MFNYGISNIDFYEIIFYIGIYSFLGWCCEVAYAYKNQKKFINRGFLHSPFCPIYGACIVSLVLLLDSFKSNIFILFIVAFFSTSFIEYSTGFLLEKIFNKKYWDYSMDPFNLHGRICLHFSLMWGAVSLGIVKIIHPIVIHIVNFIPTTVGLVLVYTLLASLILDFSSTLFTQLDLKRITNNFQFDTQIFIGKYTSLLQSSKSKYYNNPFEDKLHYLITRITRRNLK